jgi:hypothetical protein
MGSTGVIVSMAQSIAALFTAAEAAACRMPHDG